MNKKTNHRTLLTIRRPGGKTEQVEAPVAGLANDERLQQKAIKDTKAAGRGDILSFESIWDESTMPLADERECLVLAYGLALDRWHETGSAAIYATMGGAARQSNPALKSSMNAAAKALDNFDAAHPEIKKAIDLDQQRMTDRAMEL